MLGLGASGNCSEVPVFGGENADAGRRGRLLGPLRRAPTPGEGGTVGSELIVGLEGVIGGGGASVVERGGVGGREKKK